MEKCVIQKEIGKKMGEDIQETSREREREQFNKKAGDLERKNTKIRKETKAAKTEATLRSNIENDFIEQTPLEDR